MGLKINQQQSRKASALLDLLRQELLAPILSIEGHAELLKEQIEDQDCLDDLKKVETAATQTRTLVDEMLAAETRQREDEERDSERSKYKHDLRNSVGAISGYSEIILEELEDADQLSDDVRTYLNNQLTDSGKLLQMLDTLFQAEREFGEDSESGLDVDISSVFDSFDRSDKETASVISGNILVVDDNDSNRNLLAHQLSRQGHEIDTASSGLMALEMIRKSRPDLILLDLFMPDMNGFDVLREMNNDEALRAVPVIIITGLSDKSAAVKCIEAGAFDILIKPVNPGLLQARVTACLERKAWHDKALLELGITVDWVGGASIGSIFGAPVASDWSFDKAYRIARHGFVKVKPFSDYTLPLVALIRGRRMEREIQAHQDFQIEDLPIPFFCVSSVLDSGELHLHESGWLANALRASASLPGVLPPAVVDERLSVDGSVLNSMPVDIMLQKPVGKIIAVDLSSHKSYRIDYQTIPSPWVILAGRFLPFMRKYRVPSLATTMLKATEIGTQNQVRESGKQADLLLHPPVRQFGLTEVKAFEQIVETGYQYAIKELAKWLKNSKSLSHGKE